MCTTKPAVLANLAAHPQWNGFGVNSSNSRYQPKPGLTAMTFGSVPAAQSSK